MNWTWIEHLLGAATVVGVVTLYLLLDRPPTPGHCLSTITKLPIAHCK